MCLDRPDSTAPPDSPVSTSHSFAAERLPGHRPVPSTHPPVVPAVAARARVDYGPPRAYGARLNVVPALAERARADYGPPPGCAVGPNPSPARPRTALTDVSPH